MFNIKKIGDVNLKNPVLIEGLPGIGNVGKLAIDFIIEELKPELVYEITSHSFPHTVFIDEDDSVIMPTIRIYALRRILKQDILFLAGEVQPVSEEASYRFAEKVMELAGSLGCTEVVTLGGVGRPQPPRAFGMYCVGSNAEAVKNFKSRLGNFEFRSNRNIANIVGATGLLIGQAKQKGIDAVCFLVDTFRHPFHYGLRESKELILLLNKLYNLNVDTNKIDKKIKDIRMNQQAISSARKQKALAGKAVENRISYIG